MVICPNCKKELNDAFEYCNVCGTDLNGGIPGDYKTNVNNVFTNNGGVIYIFPYNGKQTIIKAKSMDDLKVKVLKKSFPWIENGKQVINQKTPQSQYLPNSSSLFLNISAEAEVKVISTSSNYKRKFIAGKDKHKTVTRDILVTSHEDSVSEILNRKNIEISSEDNINNLSKCNGAGKSWDYGVVGVKKIKENLKYIWVYEGEETLKSEYFDELKELVKSKDYDWQVIDAFKEKRQIHNDISLKKKRQNHMSKKQGSDSSNPVRVNAVHLNHRNDCSLDKMFV